MYYIFLYDSSGPVKRAIEPTANISTTNSSIVIDGLDSMKSYTVAIDVVTGGGRATGKPGNTYVITYVESLCILYRSSDIYTINNYTNIMQLLYRV